jgi:uncharacterized protein DUF4242
MVAGAGNDLGTRPAVHFAPTGARAPDESEETDMARYMVERVFPDGLEIPVTDEGAEACLGVVDRNAEHGVTWVHSYVSEDKRRTFCVYDAPDPEAIRRSAAINSLPIESITPVRVLDPYFYK